MVAKYQLIIHGKKLKTLRQDNNQDNVFFELLQPELVFRLGLSVNKNVIMIVKLFIITSMIGTRNKIKIKFKDNFRKC